MRYFLELSYLGKAYHGWQRQPNALSVQEIMENTLEKLFQKPVEIVGAGRTDAGVHAKQLFAHFDSDELLDGQVVFRLNGILPKDIAVKNLQAVIPEAHARFHALQRSYEYHIVQEKHPFSVDFAYLVKRKLDVARMEKAAQILLKHQDFKCFSRSRTDVKTYLCTIENCFWEQQDEKLIFHITANRFLRNMVRAIVGTLLQIGLGNSEITDMERIILSRDRREAGASAPAHGLYLTRIDYPKEIFLN